MSATITILLLATTLAASQEPGALRDGWELAAESVPGQRPAEDAWQPATVPGTFEAQLGADFDGVGWYRRTLSPPAPGPGAAPRYRVEFRAAATEAAVYWNGEEVGAHLGGWTPFHVALPAEADGSLRGVLEVRLDEKAGHDTQGFLPIIQPHFGGIWQDVVLHHDRGPVLDPDRTLTFGDLGAEVLRCRVAVRRQEGDGALEVVVRVRDGARVVGEARAPVAEGAADLSVSVPEPRGWRPGDPQLYDVELVLRPAGGEAVLDRLERRAGFRQVSRDGTTLLWNGQPLQVRGMLHWGFSPPAFAPPPDTARWREELELLRSLGCNLVKCCLWVPPREYYEVADEMGVLVWQEYPTWHAQLTLDHLPPLEAEFAEFFAHDRSHPSVAFRSITCETGADVDVEVLRKLYDDGHAAVPNSLIIDNSSWISWMRIHDFWDEHPYGNNGWWPGKLEELKEFIAAREAMPLLFGECMASDTWFDRPAWEAEHGGARQWFEPLCFEDQSGFEERLRARWGEDLVASLLPVSRRYALRNRKYQAERMRLAIPDGGYVLSVIRDFPKARMGFLDDLGRAKWSAEEWAWHRDTMLCLDTADDSRAFVAGAEVELPVRVSHYGPQPLRGRLDLRIESWGDAGLAHAEVEAQPGTVGAGATLRLPRGWMQALEWPVRFRLAAVLRDSAGSVLARNGWDFWVLPVSGRASPAATEVRVVRELDVATLDHLEEGGRVFLLAHPGKGSLKTEDIWFLKGAPWAPPHPLHGRVPPEVLSDLQGFDLEQGFVLRGEHLMEQVDPILAFWDTHDSDRVNEWLFAAATRVGEGRLLVSALDHETAAGQWLHAELLRFLAEGPAPERALRAEVVEGLRATLTGSTIELPAWRFRTDPGDHGLGLGWHEGRATGEGWRDMPAERHWEAEGVQYDGVAWYATTLEIPASWKGRRVHAVFEGVDDSYHLYCNGKLVARHGDPETGETVWLVRTTGDLTGALEDGATNRIVLRVVDHTGAGGMHRKAFVTTGSVDPAHGGELLN